MDTGAGNAGRSRLRTWRKVGALAVGGAMIFPLSAYSADGEDRAREWLPAPARQHQLVQMVRHDCGSCHGLTLAGGLGPALLPDALQGKPVDYLEAMILRGRPGTAMPGWKGLLSEDEARWIAVELRKGFPNER
jgi:cytochrome c55X